MITPVSKRLRSSSNITGLLEDSDFAEKLRVKNSMLLDEIHLVERHIAYPTNPNASSGMKEWYESVRTAKQVELERLRDEHGLRDSFIAAADEYNSNKKLKDESEALIPWIPRNQDNNTSRSMTSANLCTNIRALGVQALLNILAEKSTGIISKSIQIETELKGIGVSSI